MGTASFGAPTLRALADHVVLVVTQPDKPTGRGLTVRPGPIKSVAEELGLLLEAPVKSRDPRFIETVRSFDADFLLVAAYGQILSRDLLTAAKHGGINLHGSILPAYRGAAPIQRAIQNGDTATGVTLMQMDEGLDTGDVIATAHTPIEKDETAGVLFDRLSLIAAELATEWAPRLATGSYPRVPQDSFRATTAKKLTKEEGFLVLDGDSGAEYNRFRAFTPSPGAFLQTRFGALKILDARLGTAHGPRGTVASVKPSLEVCFEVGSIVINRLQAPGKRPVSASEWANGARVAVGDQLLDRVR
ncbi:MAG: methionyl-tRNA formyltransferase [Chthonomonadaceae bacterium]|nr:methionyl-tRNA formyltransferase [Chthonomonadaceae bacterium]